LNNIHVDRSTIGILNASGQIEGIQRIDINISRLDKANESNVAEALRVLTEAIVATQTISNDQRSEMLEQLDALSDQALVPPVHRKKRSCERAHYRTDYKPQHGWYLGHRLGHVGRYNSSLLRFMRQEKVTLNPPDVVSATDSVHSILGE
jgi:hypothetical protein